MLRLREAAGANIGANFDPSHLSWQQIDRCASARASTGAIFHVHAKDTGFDERRLVPDDVLETRMNCPELAGGATPAPGTPRANKRANTHASARLAPRGQAQTPHSPGQTSTSAAAIGTPGMPAVAPTVHFPDRRSS